MSEISQFLDKSSGSKYPAYKWGDVGQTVTGTIFELPKVINRPNLNTGDPEDNLVIPIHTTDNYQFSIWVRRGFLAQAISDAVKEAGATGLAVGGKLSIKHVENRDTGRPQKARVFKAKYEPPAETVPVDPFDEPF